MATREVWRVGDISEPCQLRTVKLPPEAEESFTLTSRPRKVVQLLYGHFENEILSLASNGIRKMWQRVSSDCNPSGNWYWWFSADLTEDDDSDSVACIAVGMNNFITDTDTEKCFYVISTKGGKFSVFDKETSQVIKTVMFQPPAVATFLALNPRDYKVIAIGKEDSTIQIYNWKFGEVKAELRGGHQKRISGLTFSRELNILVSSGADARLCLWRVDGWEMEKSCPIQGPPGHPAPLVGETSVQFHTVQYHLLVVHESQIAIYDAQLDCLRAWYPRDSLSSPVSSAVYSHDGRMVFAGFFDGAVGIFDFDSLTIRCRIAPCAYLSSPVPSNDNVFPVVIAAHPVCLQHLFARNLLCVNQFALGMSNGEVYVIEPSYARTQFEGSSPLQNKALPSTPTNVASTSSQPKISKR